MSGLVNAMQDRLEGADFTVVEGRNDRLFVGTYDGADVIGLYTDPASMAPQVYEDWRSTLEYRTAHFADAGIAYLNVVVPDACLVCSEDLPDGITIARPTPWQRLSALLSVRARSTSSYLLDALVAARAEHDTFQLTDSHWTDWGAYVGYRASMQALRAQLPHVPILEPERIEWTTRPSFGALGVMLTPERSERLRVAKIPDSACHVAYSVTTEVRDGVLVVEQDRPDLPTAVVFRDSFMTNAHKFFSESFRRTVYVSSPNTIFYDLVERERPDVIIFQTVERRLFRAPAEPSMFDFRMMFGDLLMDEPAAVDAQITSRTLRRAGDLDGALAANDEAFSIGKPTARLLASRASLFVELGRTRAAAEALRHATSVDPDDGPVWHLLAQALRALGLFAEAATAAARACRLEPELSALWASAALAALEADDPAGARDLAVDGLALHPKLSDLHYAQSRALVALGDVEDAETAIRSALAQRPESPLYLRQLASVLIRRADWLAARQCLRTLQLLDENADQLAGYVTLVDEHLAAAPDRPKDAP